MRAIILAGERPEGQDIALFSLLKACELLRLVFTGDERKAASKTVGSLVLGEAYGEVIARLLSGVDKAAASAVSGKRRRGA